MTEYLIGEAQSATPRISVVAVTPDNFSSLRRTIAAIAMQTIAREIELFIVAPAAAIIDPTPDEIAAFHSVRLLRRFEHETVNASRSAAVPLTRAKLIAFAEDHAFPEPGWAAALVLAHDDGNAAISGTVGNANPGSLLSWADLFQGFGPWVPPRIAGPATKLPWHHTAYDRELLISLGDELGPMLEAEGVLYARLRDQGRKMWLCSEGQLHLNMSRASSMLWIQYTGGRGYGANRAKEAGWSLPMRLLRAAAFFIVPWVRIPAVITDVRGCGRTKQLIPGILLWTLMGLHAHAIGEALGYVLGPGGAHDLKSDMETHRERFMSARDRQAIGL